MITAIKIAEKVLRIYEDLGFKPEVRQISAASSVRTFGVYDLADGYTSSQDLIEKGEIAAKEGNFTKAHELLGQAYEINKQSEQALSARAAVFLAQGAVDKATEYFERALSLNPTEVRSISGVGFCHLQHGRKDDAYKYFVRALEIDATHLVSLNKLVECSYALNRFDDLEHALRTYLSTLPDDLEIQFCLAGCLYSQIKTEASREVIDKILKVNPQHRAAKDLKDIIFKKTVLAQVLGNPSEGLSAIAKEHLRAEGDGE